MIIKKTIKIKSVTEYVIRTSREVVWQIKSFFINCKRIFDFFPIIWKTRDWDSQYATELFIFQLRRIANYLDSDDRLTVSAKYNAQRIRTTCKLLEKVNNEEYATEFIDKFESMYGKGSSDLHFEDIPDTPDLVHITQKFKLRDDADELDKVYTQLFLESTAKHERAKKLAWKLVSEYIYQWWD